MRTPLLSGCPVKTVALIAVAITLIIGSVITIATEDPWHLNFLYTFTYTTACSFFITLLLCTLHERIARYARPFYYLLFFALVTAGAILGAETGSLILYKRLVFQKAFVLFMIMVSLVASILVTSYQLLRERLEAKMLQLKEAELENERLKRYELEARLDSIRSQLNPHFLFNVLNATAELIYEAPEKAEANIVSLSTLYRKVLSVSSQSRISVEEEIELVKGYLELEKQRLGDSLGYRIECPEKLKQKLIPGLMIEPLVENCVKHNRSGAPLEVTVTVEEKSGSLFVTVSDNGPGFNAGETSLGFGLTSIQERLRLLYGDNHEFNVSSAKGKGTTVRIRFPLATV